MSADRWWPTYEVENASRLTSDERLAVATAMRGTQTYPTADAALLAAERQASKLPAHLRRLVAVGVERAVAHGGKREGAGRKPIAGTGTRRLNVSLDDATIERARQLGDGNVSEGIRIAVAQATVLGGKLKKPPKSRGPIRSDGTVR